MNMKTVRIIMVVLGSAFASTSRSADFTAWNRKAEVTFAGYTGAETLTNFPALVVLGPGTI